MGETPMALAQSRYVRRCLVCRQVRGNSAFRVAKQHGHVRSRVCRWCEEQIHNREKSVAQIDRTVARLQREEKQLAKQLGAVRAQITALVAEANAATRGQF